MSLFILYTQDPTLPMEQTHYYKWLKETGVKDVHKINTKVAYLKAKGFKLGKNFISESENFALRSIESAYFSKEILPQKNVDNSALNTQ